MTFWDELNFVAKDPFLQRIFESVAKYTIINIFLPCLEEMPLNSLMCLPLFLLPPLPNPNPKIDSDNEGMSSIPFPSLHFSWCSRSEPFFLVVCDWHNYWEKRAKIVGLVALKWMMTTRWDIMVAVSVHNWLHLL